MKALDRKTPWSDFGAVGEPGAEFGHLLQDELEHKDVLRAHNAAQSA